jgi:hypothetical protein
VDAIERQRHIEHALRGLADALNPIIDDCFGPEMGFALMLFEFHNPGIGHYISNAQRDDMIKALRELADRLEEREDIPPGMDKVQ